MKAELRQPLGGHKGEHLTDNRRLIGIAFGFVMLTIPGCKTIVDPPVTNSRSFSVVDTTFAIQTTSDYYPLVFQNPADSMAHSLSNGFVGTYWLYYDYILNPRWEFAFPALTSIDSLGTPESFPFFGASNYSQASVIYPNTLWRSNAVLFTFRQVVLARRLGQDYPIYCFEGGTGEFQPSDNSYTLMIRYKVYN